MLLTISTTAFPATDLGFLLHKHPARVQEVELSFGKAHVFYPEASAERCTAAFLLEVDPVGLVRGRGNGDGTLDAYVNDRPYVASSFMPATAPTIQDVNEHWKVAGPQLAADIGSKRDLQVEGLLGPVGDSTQCSPGPCPEHPASVLPR